MSNHFQVLDNPMFLYAGVSTAGHTKDLQAGMLGIFDTKGKAITPGTLKPNMPIRIAQGSYHQKDTLGKFYTGLKKSVKSADFLAKDVSHIEFSPFRKPQNEKWVFGYDGLNDCTSFNLECGKTYALRFRIYGEGVYNNMDKQVFRDISISTGCCDTDECAGGCPDNVVNPVKYIKEWIKKINSDVEVSKFIKSEIVLPTIAAKTMTHKVMALSVCDNGDQEALNAVQRAYPTHIITRVDRVGSTSVYNSECIPNATVFAPYVPTNPVLLAVCGTCNAGYTLVPESFTYVVTRPLAGTEVLVTDADKLAEATTIAGEYGGASPVFLSSNIAGITVQFSSTDAALVVLKADTIVSSTKVLATCTPTAATPIAWVKIADKYVTTRKKCMILAKKDCSGGDRLAEIIAAYADNKNIVPNSIVLATPGACEDKYEIEQYSECMSDGCLTEPAAIFPEILPFENTPWIDCPCETPVPDTITKVGIRFEVSSSYDSFGNCSWNPDDYYTFKPTMMEVSLVENDGAFCKVQPTARRIQAAIMPNQTGDWAVREYMDLAAYLYNQAFDTDPRLREILGSTIYQIIDRKAYYNVYYIKFKQYRSNNFYGNTQNSEVYELPILVKDGVDTKPLETALNSYFSAVGVTVQPRIGQLDI